MADVLAQLAPGFVPQAVPGLTSGESVLATPEFARVAGLARRRDLTPGEVEAVSAWARLRGQDDRCPGVDHSKCGLCEGDGVLRLRPLQALGLVTAAAGGGLFAPLKVGTGKTLLSLLLPTLFNSKRPVLVVPGALKDEPAAAYAKLCKAWRVRLPQVVTYSKIAHPDNVDELLYLRPDILICDEAQKLHNWDSTTTQRFERALRDLEVKPKVAMLSGTLIGDELLQYWHLLLWSLGERAPVPRGRAEAERWALALDGNVPSHKRVGFGALAKLDGGPHAWIRNSAGVAPTAGGEIKAKLEIHPWTPVLPPQIRQLIDDVDATGLRPDGVPLGEWGRPDCKCQLVQGFYYVWSPLPPQSWMQPRSDWFAYERYVAELRLDAFDSPARIVRGLLAKDPQARPPCWREGLAVYRAWKDVEDSFTPNCVPVWVDDSVLRQSVALARMLPPTLIWTRHEHAGLRLAQYGIPYYGGDTAPHTRDKVETIALSFAAHGTGKDGLQRWASNLWLSPMADPKLWEQGLGRTHRPGQRADVVRNLVISAIDYHEQVMDRVVGRAFDVGERQGFKQKLVDGYGF